MNKAFFTDYCGNGSYETSFLEHSGIEHCIDILERFGIPVDSVFVLGAATGQVLRVMEEAWGVRPWGCEISRWAHSRIPGVYRRRIQRADMRRCVPELAGKGKRFDLVFTNSLIYLEPGEIPDFLAAASSICRYIHSYSSTSENREKGDRYIATLRPRRWWRRRFLEAGFAPTRSWYLWRSTR